jgi:hypothetical protein
MTMPMRLVMMRSTRIISIRVNPEVEGRLRRRFRFFMKSEAVKGVTGVERFSWKKDHRFPPGRNWEMVSKTMLMIM